MSRYHKDGELRWKLDFAQVGHAIDSCDANATAWVSLCGKTVFGPTRTHSQLRCPDCRKLAKLRPSMGSKERHGLRLIPEYSVWYNMKKRCFNKNTTGYANYGGRGITVCDEWCKSFKAFYRDMGNRPTPRYMIERINNNGNYEPSNCKWATMKEQANNRIPYPKHRKTKHAIL